MNSLDRQTQEDLSFVLGVLQATASPAVLDAHLEEMGNTVEQLDTAMKRLGEIAGLDAGLL